MKILIMSVKAGFGHHSAAQSMIECFEKHGIECEMMDTLEYVSKILGDGVQDGYLLSTKYLKEAYGRVYSSFDKKEEPRYKYSPLSVITRQIARPLRKYIHDFNPDIVIATHSFAAVIISVLKNRFIINCPTYGVVTDFTIHPFWESTELDYYILPNELLTTAAMKKGIPKEKILPFGIPIKQKFTKKADKVTARENLGILNKTTVLVMMGSMGFGKMFNLIGQLDKYPADFQIICVCGNNEKMKNKIDEASWQKQIYNLGFINNVDEYMDAADLIITKPGGLTTSEALAKKLPLILSNPIPGQEDRNVEFLVNSGAAINVTETFPLESALFQYFDSGWRAELMMQAVGYISKPNAAEDLYEFIMENTD